MGLQIGITPYGGGGLRVWARGHCSGLLCYESQEAADNSDLLWKSCELVTARLVMDDPAMERLDSRGQILECVHQIMAGNVDLVSRLHH